MGRRGPLLHALRLCLTFATRWTKLQWREPQVVRSIPISAHEPAGFRCMPSNSGVVSPVIEEWASHRAGELLIKITAPIGRSSTSGRFGWTSPMQCLSKRILKLCGSLSGLGYSTAEPGWAAVAAYLLRFVL
jgi:hypothetical protein